MQRVFRFAPFLLLIALWGCGRDAGGGNTPGAPQITSFTASPSSITSAGEAVTLSWTITGTPTSLEIDNGVGSVSGNSRIVNPTATTTYTLTAGNSSGDTTKTVVVTVGGGTSGSEPTGTFGGSLSETGPYQSDASGGISDPNDSRIVRGQAGSTIYFQASYTDTDGITSVVPYLANDRVNTPLTPGSNVNGFTSAAPTDCTPDGSQQAVTCTFAVSIASGTQNITDIDDFPGEFAYVFKVNVTDGTGTVTSNSSRAYVTVGVEGGTPTDPTAPDPTTPDPTDPTTPDPTDPTTPDPTDPTTPDPTDPTTPEPTDPTTPDPTEPTAPDPTEPTDPTEPEPVAPEITSFTATPESIDEGGSSTLAWTVSGTVTSLSINNGVGTVSGMSTTVSPDDTTTYTLTAANGSATDTATVTVEVGDSDTTPPTVTVNQASTQSDPATSLPISFTAVFSEDVTGFDMGDLLLGGTAIGATAAATVTGGPATYTISISGLTADGSVIVTIGSGAAADAAGNSSSASTGADNTVTYDAP